MRTNGAAMHWCKSVQACLAISQERVCSRFQMSHIPNVGGLLNHLAQLITASHVFQKTQKATLPRVYASSMNG